MNRKERKRREALKARKAEIHIKLCGLRFELSAWDRLTQIKINFTHVGDTPPAISKRIGELEAERDLINLVLIVEKWERMWRI